MKFCNLYGCWCDEIEDIIDGIVACDCNCKGCEDCEDIKPRW